MTGILSSLLQLGGGNGDSSGLTMAILGAQRKALVILDVHNMAIAKSRMEGTVSVSIGSREAYVLQVNLFSLCPVIGCLKCILGLGDHPCAGDNGRPGDKSRGEKGVTGQGVILHC